MFLLFSRAQFDDEEEEDADDKLSSDPAPPVPPPDADRIFPELKSSTTCWFNSGKSIGWIGEAYALPQVQLSAAASSPVTRSLLFTRKPAPLDTS